jgi:glycosyltransferase involved in cell wall biosynthesis
LLAHYSDLNLSVKVGLSRERLVREIQQSDLFVLPSLVEGFAHVILEAMACGVPVLTTSHTCAPDVMSHGEHGFVVPIRDSQAIATHLAWSMDNRADLATMGEAAAMRAGEFTWERFRSGVRGAYRRMLADVC